MGELFYRSFDGELGIKSTSDGRTVFGAAVPFDLPTRINDHLVESFDRKAFDHQLNAVHRVQLYHRHSAHGGKHVGHLTMARPDPKHLYVEGKVSKTRDGDDYLEMVRDGSLPHFSIGFMESPNGTQMRNGVAHRVRVDLIEVAGEPIGAYGDAAAVAGVRSLYGEAGICPTCGQPTKRENRLAATKAMLASLPPLAI